MSLTCRALIFAALLAGTAGPAQAATLGIAWDSQADATVTGYRVYVGTSAGQHTESFDVGRVQTSFFYTTGQAGRRYYFAVASLASGVAGAKSAEVSAVAGGGAVIGDPSQPLPQQPSSPQIPPDFWLTYGAGKRGAANRDVLTPGAVDAVASGLADVTSVAALPTGGGFLVEAGATVLAFADQGVWNSPVFEAAEGTRIAAIIADSHFETTGLVFTAEAQQTPDGGENVFVVRHRLLGGSFGESAAVAVGRHQPAGTAARLAITNAGEVILVQGEARALAWDDLRGGLWSVGIDAASTVAFSFSPVRTDGVTAVGGLVEPIAGGQATVAAVAVLDGTPKLAVASPTAVFRFDVAASHLSAGTSVADHGTVVSLVSASTNVDYVVVRQPAKGAGEAATFALLRVQHTDLP